MNTLKHQALTALTTMIVVGALGVLIILFTVLSGIDLLQQGLYDTEYNETFAGADACIEEALFKLNSDSGYTGEDFTIGSVECTATVSGVGSTRTVKAVATQGSLYVSRHEVTVDLSTSPISITNWEEVDS